MRVLVVTATAGEADTVAAGLTRWVSRGTRHLPGGHAVACFALRDPAPDGAPRSGSSGAPAVDILTGGVGPAAVAASTATLLALAARQPATEPGASGAGSDDPRRSAGPAAYDLVLSAGIGGGFQPLAPVGSLVVADEIIAAELGSTSPDGFLSIDELGFGRNTHVPPAGIATRLAKVLDSDPGIRAILAPVLTVSTVTGTAAGTAELRARHPRAGAEAMEGFGVAEAAAAHSVPFAEIRAISNAIGPRDRPRWRIDLALDSLRSAFTLLSPVFEEPS